MRQENIKKPPKSDRPRELWDGGERRNGHRILWQEGARVYYYDEELVGKEARFRNKRASYRKDDYD